MTKALKYLFLFRIVFIALQAAALIALYALWGVVEGVNQLLDVLL